MKFSRIALLSLCFGSAVLLTSCSEEGKSVPNKSKDKKDTTNISGEVSIVPITDVAISVIHPTQGNKVNGKVTFTKVKEGIKIVADIDGLTPGKHGFHVHEK